MAQYGGRGTAGWVAEGPVFDASVVVAVLFAAAMIAFTLALIGFLKKVLVASEASASGAATGVKEASRAASRPKPGSYLTAVGGTVPAKSQQCAPESAQPDGRAAGNSGDDQGQGYGDAQWPAPDGQREATLE